MASAHHAEEDTPGKLSSQWQQQVAKTSYLVVDQEIEKESQNQGLGINIKGLLLMTYFHQVRPSS